MPVQLLPKLIGHQPDELSAIAGWPFADDYVARLLREDVPQRVNSRGCRVWAYSDPARGEGDVGFGTLELCSEYARFTNGLTHSYIPLLAVRPGCEGNGYGKAILKHLIAEAAVLVRIIPVSDLLFLDVYTTNTVAIGMYEKHGFAILEGGPFKDAAQDDTTYHVMARRVSLAPSSDVK